MRPRHAALSCRVSRLPCPRHPEKPPALPRVVGDRGSGPRLAGELPAAGCTQEPRGLRGVSRGSGHGRARPHAWSRFKVVGADENRGEGPSPPPRVSRSRLAPPPESFLGPAARPGSGGEPRARRWRLSPATPTLAALAPLQRRSVSRALLALKVGLEYFNRAIKRMLTYICQEIHI